MQPVCCRAVRSTVHAHAHMHIDWVRVWVRVLPTDAQEGPAHATSVLAEIQGVAQRAVFFHVLVRRFHALHHDSLWNNGGINIAGVSIYRR